MEQSAPLTRNLQRNRKEKMSFQQEVVDNTVREETGNKRFSLKPSEVLRLWGRRADSPLDIIPDHAEFSARRRNTEDKEVTIVRLHKDGFCRLMCADLNVCHELEVRLLTEAALVGQSERVSIRLAAGNMLSVNREELTKALKTLRYLPKI